MAVRLTLCCEQQAQRSHYGDRSYLRTTGLLTMAPVDEVLAVGLQNVVRLADETARVVQHFKRREVARIPLDEHLLPRRECVPRDLGNTARSLRVRNQHRLAVPPAVGNDALVAEQAQKGRVHNRSGYWPKDRRQANHSNS